LEYTGGRGKIHVGSQLNDEFTASMKFLPKGFQFPTMQEFIKLRAKEVQITSSKFVATKLHKDPPVMHSTAIQVEVITQDEYEQEKLENEIFKLNMEIEAKANQFDRLWQEIKSYKNSKPYRFLKAL
jgi:hypothetical protein